MGKVRGKRNGTGPHKDSYQKKTVGQGRRKQAGEPCPKTPVKGKKR